jgi:hypothetical protein
VTVGRLRKSESQSLDNACQFYTVQREITRNYTIKILMKHAHAWNWDRKGGRNLSYEHNQENPPSPEGGNRSSFRKVVLSRIPDDGKCPKTQ